MADIWMNVDAALSEVPVNIMPLIDSGDFVTIEASVAYNAAGMALKWNFVTTAGAMTQTAVTPTSGGDYDWGTQGNGMYSLEIPASGGASINNDTEGFGWFSGVATGVLPWRGPIIGFRPAIINDALVNGSDKLQVDLVQIDGQATSGNNATLNLKQLNIVNNAGSALVASATGSNGSGIAASGNGSGEGIVATGGATGNGIEAIGGGTSGDGFNANAAGSGLDINAPNSDLGTLASADDAVLAQLALVKAKTDQLVFTKANEVDANIQSINGTTVNGDGSGTPWGP